jgi:hypothetical protein
MNKVKCLSIRNPFSYLVASGLKDVENRSWSTEYRGTLYIHSSGKLEQPHLREEDLPEVIVDELEKLAINEVGEIVLTDPSDYVDYLRYYSDLEIVKSNHYEIGNDDPFFKRGCIIGKVDLVDIITDSQSPFANPYSKHWILENAVLFKKPITNIKGKLGFFETVIDEPEGVRLGQPEGFSLEV